MHTFSEDVGNEILVNRYIFCAQVHLMQNGDFSSLNSAWNVLPRETVREEPTVSKGLLPASCS